MAKLGKSDSAISAYNAGLKLHLGNRDILLAKGWVLFSQKRYSKVIDACNRALEKNCHDEAALGLRANALQLMQAQNEARISP